MFSLGCFSLIVRIFVVVTLYIYILYIYIRKRVLSTEAAMFVTVAQTGQTKHLFSFSVN